MADTTHTIPQAGPTGSLAATGPPTGTLAATRPVPPGPTTAAAEEVRVVLRGRLLASLAVFSVAIPVMFAFALLGEAENVFPGVGPTAAALLTAGPFSLIAGLLAWLWRNPEVPLARLRAVEMTVFGLAVAVLGAARYAAFAAAAIDAPDERVGPPVVARAVAVSNIGFYFVIIYYGALVPNTRRRGAAVVAALAAVPLAVTAAAGVAHPALRPYMPMSLGMTATGLFMSAAVAVFSAARTDALRRRAVEAERAGQLGPYTLLRKLGAGGMGEVHLAEHKLLKRPCAVKLIRPELSAHPDALARFAREVRAVTTLSHVNTVRVYDYGQSADGTFYYVMEYLNGPTLDQLVKDGGPLPPGRAVYLLRQVCGALSEAHAAGLVHRDLKPGNVVVATLGGQPDVAKLLDFGLVHLAADAAGGDRLTQAGAIMGTPAFMCPEQAGGESTIDARGDVYSLGAVAFFAVTGRPPFDDPTVRKLLSAHLTQTPPRADAVRPGVPADLADVIARCLAKEPADRFASAADLDRALAACRCGDWRPT